LALRFADLMVCTAVLSAAFRAANVCWLRQVCRAIEPVSRMMMASWLPRPREKLLTHVWYWLRSGAPPALAPPQSRLVISYTEINGTCPAALAAPTKEEASCCTVEGLKLLNHRACGWLAMLVRMTAARESPPLAATHRTT